MTQAPRGPADEHEAFFVVKIDQGLAAERRPKLTDEQRRLLSTPVLALTPEESQVLSDLQDLGVTALRSAYARDTSLEFTEGMSGHDRRTLINEPMEQWKRHNRGIYETSENVITGIVQTWYLDGRSPTGAEGCQRASCPDASDGPAR